jgi:hypothetical protein
MKTKEELPMKNKSKNKMNQQAAYYIRVNEHWVW